MMLKWFDFLLHFCSFMFYWLLDYFMWCSLIVEWFKIYLGCAILFLATLWSKTVGLNYVTITLSLKLFHMWESLGSSCTFVIYCMLFFSRFMFIFLFSCVSYSQSTLAVHAFGLNVWCDHKQ